MSEEIYSTIKKVLWRVGRIFVDGALSALTIEALTKAAGFELEQGVKYLAIVVLAAGIAGVTKYLREKADSYESRVHKLPL